MSVDAAAFMRRRRAYVARFGDAEDIRPDGFEYNGEPICFLGEKFIFDLYERCLAENKTAAELGVKRIQYPDGAIPY